MNNPSPAAAPAAIYVMRCPSGDQRMPSRFSPSTLRGRPGSGAGSSHVENAAELPRGRAMTAMRDPSGEISSPPTPVPLLTSKSVDAVRFTAPPPLRNFTQTFAGPPAFDTYATHLPSGEITGPTSLSGPLVSRTILGNVGVS